MAVRCRLDIGAMLHGVLEVKKSGGEEVRMGVNREAVERRAVGCRAANMYTSVRG